MVDIPLLKQKVLNFLGQNGPTVPIRLSSVLGSDSFFAGAILSELIAEGKVRISTAKLGRSPVYYLHGQENRLDVLYFHLPDKEKEAYDFLKERKLVRDTEAIPSIRVAFRMMKDFAVPFMVKTPVGDELHWKWHLASDDEARALQTVAQPIAVQQTLVQQRATTTEALVEQQPFTKLKQAKADEFSTVVHRYLAQANLKVVESAVIRKNMEIHAVVCMPSNLGELELLVIAKNKKKISDADLTLAHQKGLNKKLLTVFLTNGELTKKATTHLEKNLKGLLMLRRLQ